MSTSIRDIPVIHGLKQDPAFRVTSREISCSTSVKTQIRETKTRKKKGQYEKSKPETVPQIVVNNPIHNKCD